MSDVDPSPTSPRPWRTVLARVAVVGLVLAAAQAIGWRLDPPQALPNGIYARDLYLEGAFKAHEARRWALYGTFTTNPADEYRFWWVQSPLHVGPLAVWLRAVGVTWSNLRLYSVLTFAAGWLVLLATALRTRRDGAALAVGLALVGDFTLRHAARSGLIEVPLTSWACVAFALAVAASRQPAALFGLPLVATAAVLTKQSGLVLAPFAAVVALGVGWAHRDHPRLRPVALAWVGLCALLAVGLLSYAFTDDYWRTVEWNADHMFGDDDNDTTRLHLGLIDPVAIGGRLLDPARWRDAVLWYVPATLPGLLLAARDAWRRRRTLAADDRIAWALFGLSLSLLFLTHQIRLRFSLLLLPMAWWLAGRGLAEALRRHRRTGLVAIALSALIAVATHGRWHAEHARTPSTSLFDTNAALADALPHGARLVGRSAPFLAFNTAADHFVVRKPFNCSAPSLRALDPTHILRLPPRYPEYTRRCFRRLHRDWRDLWGEEIRTTTWRGHTLVLQTLDLSPHTPQTDERTR